MITKKQLKDLQEKTIRKIQVGEPKEGEKPKFKEEKVPGTKLKFFSKILNKEVTGELIRLNKRTVILKVDAKLIKKTFRGVSL